jgi:AcrR family transcriptional regulator
MPPRSKSRKPRGRKPVAAPQHPLDRRHIASAALRLIDAKGLENFSMRRLGAALGVEAMAIYHHFQSKAEVMDGVVELLLDEIEPALFTEKPPLERLRDGFRALRRLAITHPHAFWILAARRFRTLRALEFYERLLEVFRDAGFEAPLAARYFRLLAAFVTGAGMAEIGSRALQPHATPVILEDFSDPESFPRVSEVVPHLRVSNLDAIFEFGLATIFEAMEASLANKKRTRRRG